ncbi:MAG TPA: hypothetical protein VGI42_06920 [Chthoniobacterales bacterium]
MQNILNSGFAHLTPEVLYQTGLSITTALTGNPNFTTTDPALAVILSDLDELKQALGMPKGQARDQAILAARRKLEGHLADLATNLEKTASGDRVKLATTGFGLRKQAGQSSDAPSTPLNLRLKATGVSGEVQVLFEASPRAKSYQVQTSLDPNGGVWTDYDPFSSTRGIVLKGLLRAKDIWVRVRAIGPNNTKSGWSDPATILVS